MPAGARDRAPGLGHQQRPRPHAGVGERLRDRFLHARSRMRRSSAAVVAREVAHAEPAAEIQLVDRRARLVLDRAHEADHLLDGRARTSRAGTPANRCGSASRRTAATAPSTTRCTAAQRVAALEAEAELRVLGAGLDVLVRVRLDAGRDADVHARRGESSATSASSRSSSSNESTTMRPTPDLERGTQLRRRLVVAVEHDARRAGTRPCSATYSSPPVATSRCSPSSCDEASPSRRTGTPCSRRRRRRRSARGTARHRARSSSSS